MHAKSSQNWLASRARLLAVASGLGLAFGLSCERPSERTKESLAEALGRVSHSDVTHFAWEPERSPLVEFTRGRAILFEARPHAPCASASAKCPPTSGTTPRDVFRAFVRLAPDGTPLSIHGVRNLTNTSRADEGELRVSADLAFFATLHDGEVASLTALALVGAPAPRGSWLSSLRERVSNFLETGQSSGLGRVDVLLTTRTGRLTAELREKKLFVRTESGLFGIDQEALRHPTLARPSSIESHFTAPAAPADSNTAPTAASADAAPTNVPLVLVPRVPEPVPFFHWAADVGRRLVGTGAIAWLEGRVFGTLDRLHQASDYVSRGGAAPEVRPLPPPAPQPPTTASAPVVWPPRDLPPRLSTAPESDGHWRPVTSKLLPSERNTPPLFYRTVVHPDVARPYAEVHLVALDTRRLDLDMRAGYEDPHPQTGPPGSGHVPNDPAFTSRLVATFNGAFKAVHGEYGMQAEGRLLVEPVASAATVRVDADGRVGLGSYPKDPAPEELNALTLGGLVSFRQNLDPLVENGVINPRKRAVWGDHLYGESVATERSALCVTQGGQLVYAWSKEAAGETLAEALLQAECSYGIHLDMNPGHCQFAFHRMKSFQPLVADAEILDARMEVNPNRYLRWSPKDFFTVTLRTSVPAATPTSDGAPHSLLTWQPAPGKQPDLPVALGSGRMGHVALEVDRVALDAIRLDVLPGTEDARGELTASPALDDVLLTFGLGHRSQANRPGLAVNEQSWVPTKRTEATLVLEADKRPVLVAPGIPVEPRAGLSLVQFPVLARDGELTELARQIGDHRRRAALCFDAAGHLLVGRVDLDTSAPLVEVLLSSGCSLVVALDRGSHHPAFVARSGVDPAPTRLDQSLLLVYRRELPTRGYHWQP